MKKLLSLLCAAALALTLAARAGLIASLPHMRVAMTLVAALRFLFSIKRPRREGIT